MKDFFISYSHEDSDFVDRIDNMLKTYHPTISYFLDRKDINYGENIVSSAEKAVVNCKCLIVVVSEASKESQWVPYEAGIAKGTNKRIVQLLVTKSTRPFKFFSSFKYAAGLEEFESFVQKYQEEISSFESPYKLFKEHNDYLLIDQAIPYYEESNIVINDGKAEFIIGIPNSHKEKLANFDFENIEKQSDFLKTKLTESFKTLGLERESLIESSLSVAESFLSDIEDGHTRFNSTIVAIEKVRNTRIPSGSDGEKAGIQISTYKTDYFTHRVFSKIYEKLRTNGLYPKITQLPDLVKYPVFLSSFGLGCFIIIDRGFGNEVLIGKRSQGVIVDKGKLHFTMNEAFTVDDKDEHGKLSLEGCLYRGLKEEIGINKGKRKNIREIAFMDLSIEMNRFEMGISSFVKLEFTDDFNYTDLLNCFRIAQDRKLEIESLTPVKINDLENFIKDNGELMSVGCKATLTGFLIRYQNGYLTNKL